MICKSLRCLATDCIVGLSFGLGSLILKDFKKRMVAKISFFPACRQTDPRFRFYESVSPACRQTGLRPERDFFTLEHIMSTPSFRHPSKGGEYIQLPLLWRGAHRAGWFLKLDCYSVLNPRFRFCESVSSAS